MSKRSNGNATAIAATSTSKPNSALVVTSVPNQVISTVPWSVVMTCHDTKAAATAMMSSKATRNMAVSSATILVGWR